MDLNVYNMHSHAQASKSHQAVDRNNSNMSLAKTDKTGTLSFELSLEGKIVEVTETREAMAEVAAIVLDAAAVLNCATHVQGRVEMVVDENNKSVVAPAQMNPPAGSPQDAHLLHLETLGGGAPLAGSGGSGSKRKPQPPGPQEQSESRPRSQAPAFRIRQATAQPQAVVQPLPRAHLQAQGSAPAGKHPSAAGSAPCNTFHEVIDLISDDEEGEIPADSTPQPTSGKAKVPPAAPHDQPAAPPSQSPQPQQGLAPVSGVGGGGGVTPAAMADPIQAQIQPALPEDIEGVATAAEEQLEARYYQAQLITALEKGHELQKSLDIVSAEDAAFREEHEATLQRIKPEIQDLQQRLDMNEQTIQALTWAHQKAMHAQHTQYKAVQRAQTSAQATIKDLQQRLEWSDQSRRAAEQAVHVQQEAEMRARTDTQATIRDLQQRLDMAEQTRQAAEQAHEEAVHAQQEAEMRVQTHVQAEIEDLQQLLGTAEHSRQTAEQACQEAELARLEAVNGRLEAGRRHQGAAHQLHSLEQWVGERQQELLNSQERMLRTKGHLQQAQQTATLLTAELKRGAQHSQAAKNLPHQLVLQRAQQMADSQGVDMERACFHHAKAAAHLSQQLDRFQNLAESHAAQPQAEHPPAAQH